nr:immunoglobulin light chain junction region [Macaca mulatta]
CMQGLQFPLTF